MAKKTKSKTEMARKGKKAAPAKKEKKKVAAKKSAARKPAKKPKRKATKRKPRPVAPSPEKPRYYITTAISYPNAPPHIGHAYEVIATDAIARFMRLDGYD